MTRSGRSARPLGISPETLDRAPHLGLLDVVDHALRVAAWSLYAEFPGLIGEPHPWHPEPPEQVAARRMLRQMYGFAQAMARYRRTLAPLLTPQMQQPPDDEIDF